MKKMLFLGGSQQQLPPIIYAKERGYHTIVCDYIPNNPGSKIADESFQESTTDLEAILNIAQEAGIDGIVAYASDPAAPTAAYVAEQMGLPGNPYESVQILARKDLYRQFLLENGFNTPRFGYSAQFPCVIKPVDSSGSKGVSVADSPWEVVNAVNKARMFSKSGDIILEDYIRRDGFQIAGDGFIVDGNLVFAYLANEHFAEGCMVPKGESFPYCGAGTGSILAEVQRLITALGMKTGALNFDIVLSDGKIYLMEIGPRNGGNLIPEVTKYASGVDMIAATVEAALGNEVVFPEPEHRGFYASYIIHSTKEGVCQGISIDESLDVVKQDLRVDVGDKIHGFTGSHQSLGMMIMKFSSEQEMLGKMAHMEDYVRVEVR